MNPRFRVWDTLDKKMFIVRELYLGVTGPTAVRTIGNVSTGHYKKTDFLRMPRGIVMQWTNELDKNGAEIYAGDIVKLTYGYGELEGGNHEVIWYQPSVGFDLLPKGDTGFAKLMRDDDVWVEVIGNIHATPELLKTKV